MTQDPKVVQSDPKTKMDPKWPHTQNGPEMILKPKMVQKWPQEPKWAQKEPQTRNWLKVTQRLSFFLNKIILSEFLGRF